MTGDGCIAIVNPRSGGHRSSLEPLLSRLRQHADEVALTEGPGHATDLAALASRYAGILVAGGDGTVNEVLQGMDCATQSLAVLPRGRGNSLARDLDAAPRPIDLMSVTFEHASGVSTSMRSASTVAMGYPATVAGAADRRFRAFGRGCYAASAAFTHPEAFSGVLSYDDGPASYERLTGLIANNTRHLANFLALPNARVSDGRFDTMALRLGFVGQSLHNLAALAGHSHTPVPPVAASRVRLSIDEPRVLLIDGELFADVVSIDVRVLPAAVTCALAS